MPSLHTLTQAHSLWVCIVTAPSIRAISKRVLCRSAPDTNLESLHANTNHNKHHLCKGTRRSRASHTAGAWFPYAHSNNSSRTRRHRTRPLPPSSPPQMRIRCRARPRSLTNSHKSSLKHARTPSISGHVSLPPSSLPPIYFST
jgi:hypothetical protein